MNITLTGNLGSGKGSVSEIFKKWGFGYVSGGDVFRAVAKEKGLTVLEMNELAKKDRSIDDLIDARSARLGDELDNTLFDSRLAWNFVRESFKVFLLVDTDESARRVFNGKSRESEEYANQDECADGLGQRANLERERFRKLYNIDYYDAGNYDLVIESTNATPEEIAGEIRRCFEEYKKEKFSTRIELNLKAMYPQQDLTDGELEKIKSAAEHYAAENKTESNLRAEKHASGASQAEDHASGTSQAEDPASGASQAEEPESGASQAEDPASGASQAEDPASGASQAENRPSGTSQAEDPASGASQAESHASENPAITLASAPVSLISRNGYNYIDGDAAALMAEAASGKVFGLLKAFHRETPETEASGVESSGVESSGMESSGVESSGVESSRKVPSSENLKKLESAAGFMYRSLPEEKPVKHEYMMDLSC